MLVGTLSDMFGRKRLAIYSMVGDGIFFFLSGSMVDPLSMLIVRFFAGMFCPIPCAYGWVIDVSPDPSVRAKRLGYTTAFIMGGMFFGFAVAGVVGEFFGLLYAMIIPSILAFSNALFILFIVPTPKVEIERQKKRKAANGGKNITTREKPNPKPVMKTGTWLSVALVNFAVGLQVGHFTAVSMMMMVKKHKLTPSGLAMFNVSTICVMILANAYFFPWCYKRMGPYLMMPLFCGLAGLTNSVAFYLEYDLALYMGLTIPSFLLTMTLLPTGQTIAATLTKHLAPNAVGTVQGLTRMTFDAGKTVAPVISTALYGEGNGTLISYLWVTVIMVLAAINYGINGKKDGGAFNIQVTDTNTGNDDDDKANNGIGMVEKDIRT